MNLLAPRLGKLGLYNANHLLRRTSYLVTQERIEKFASLTAEQAFSELFRNRSLIDPEPLHYETKEKWIQKKPFNHIQTPQKLRNLIITVIAWWLNEARQDEGVSHKMTFFLHTVFTVNVSSSASSWSPSIFDHLELLRYYSLGNIKSLGKKITLDNLMLTYLDNGKNSKDQPNENYAREFLELFTIGKGAQVASGNYTTFQEADVVAAARLFSGYRRDNDRNIIDPDTGIPCGFAKFEDHDNGDKTFSSAFNNQTIRGAQSKTEMAQELNDFIEMIFHEEATAVHICSRIYRFFVSSRLSEDVKQGVILPLAKLLIEENYELYPVLKKLFCSQHFYGEDTSDNAAHIIGSLVKSPLELALHLFSFIGFNGTLPDSKSQPKKLFLDFYYQWAKLFLFPSGLKLFSPNSVAGYPAYYQEPGYDKNWLGSSILLARHKLVEPFIADLEGVEEDPVAGVRLDIVKFVCDNVSAPEKADILVSEMLNSMFCVTPSKSRLAYFINDVFLSGLSPAIWTAEWKQYKETGEDLAIRIPLERLLRKITTSQEYQLF